ncbi:MAG: Crp/Fnr family transcriptional regulator [Acidobacteriota bacterium]|nr:Crp/Fnr family transcriptional regulator [Acidobacteriota bacterium]
MKKKEYPFEFPPDQHADCQTLTELTIEHLPPDGSLGRVLGYRKNSYVWQTDDHPDTIYFLRQGEIAVFFSDSEGREVALQTVEVGKAFGELCFCGKHKLRGSLARAVAPSEAIAITLGDFMDYMQTNREVLAALVWTYCVRLADAQRRLEILANRGAEQRLGHLLLHLAVTQNQKYGEPPGEIGAATLPISHNELAQMAAMSRPHVSVTMNKLRQRGFVDYGRNRLLMVNVPVLRKHLTGE